MKARILGFLAVGLLVGPMGANAVVITSQSGDMDCFGLGGTCADGDSYTSLGGVFFADNSTASDPVGTDNWAVGPRSFGHTIALGGALAGSAIMEMFVAGPDLGTGLGVFLNGTFLGSYVEPDTSRNTANTVQFVVPFAALLDGLNTLSLTPSEGGDGYIIDYTKLSVTTALSVPEPGTLALLGLGLAGLGLSRRRKTH